jgi:predicted metal-dependent phosphoesterase TrpH
MARHEPLLCELHAHSTWSDGTLTLRELVDLYGAAGFDVLAVTDHQLRAHDPWFATATDGAGSVHAGNHTAYLDAIEAEAERARSRYGLLVVPGVELTYNDPAPERAAHAVAIGLRSFVPLEDGLDAALAGARAAGAALVAAHPYALSDAAGSTRGTARWAAEPDWAATVVDRFEVVNRHELFPWVAERRLPAIASGDFHRRDHLHTWKTVIRCEKREEAVVEHLRTGRPASLSDPVRLAA